MSCRWTGLLLAAAVGVCSPASAQDSAQSDRDGPGILGVPSERSRAILGGWGMHPFEPQFPELDWTSGFGLAVGQYYAVTFVNSYGNRGFIGALERYWGTASIGRVDVGVGYRVGLVTGYDERLFALANYTPVLPFAGLLVSADIGPLGIESVYVYKAITLEASLRLR